MPELRISAVIQIPDEPFASAAAMMAAKPIVDSLEGSVVALGGTVSHSLVTPKPRGEKEAA